MPGGRGGLSRVAPKCVRGVRLLAPEAMSKCCTVCWRSRGRGLLATLWQDGSLTARLRRPTCNAQRARRRHGRESRGRRCVCAYFLPSVSAGATLSMPVPPKVTTPSTCPRLPLTCSRSVRTIAGCGCRRAVVWRYVTDTRALVIYVRLDVAHCACNNAQVPRHPHVRPGDDQGIRGDDDAVPLVRSCGVPTHHCAPPGEHMWAWDCAGYTNSG